MRNIFNLIGIIIISISLLSCGGDVDKQSMNQNQEIKVKKESIEKIKPKCNSDAKEFQINNNIISSITLSKIECQENSHLDSEIRDLLNKDKHITFLKNQENVVSGETEGYKIKIDGIIQISKKEYNASLYYDPIYYKENIEFYGMLVVLLDVEEFSIRIRGSKKK